jgi:hypothetical protein
MTSIRIPATWAAGPAPGGARRGLQVSLGLLWLADAALQYQPFMFGPAFVTGVLAPPTAGQPAIIAGPARYADQLIAHNVAACNAAFATIQLALGLGLLWRRTAKAALAASLAWSLGVWWLGEGMGGLLTGAASPLTGAPGAALLYALAAVLVWPTASSCNPGRARSTADTVAAGSPLGRRGAALLWVILWAGSACLLLLPAARAPGTLRGSLAGLADGEPGWLALADHRVAALAGGHQALSGLLAAVFILVAAGILVPRTTRAALAVAGCMALLIWVAGENFGGLLTGQATDVNSGPLLVLLAAAFWPLRPAAGRAAARGTVAGSAAVEPGTVSQRTM